MNELLTKLKTKYSNITLSRVHLGRVVIKNQIKEFYNKVKQYRLDDIICIDFF